MKHFENYPALMAMKIGEGSKSVSEQYNALYAKHGRPDTAFECAVIENQSYRDAYDKLNGTDKDTIAEIVKTLTNGPQKLPKFGETSALELCAKIGIFLNGVKTS